MTKKTFSQVLKDHNDNFRKKTDELLKKFFAEQIKLKLKTVAEMDELWSKKYKKKLDKMDAVYEIKYRALYMKFLKAK